VDMARTKLGKVWVEQERYEEAKSLLQPARSRTLQGAESPVHAACLHWLALAFMGQERWAEAEPLLSEALDLFRRLKGEADPATEECESDLVRLLIGLDWPADAADLARAQLERRRGRLAEDDPLIADTLALLGRAQLAGAPASAEAEATLRQCLELRTRKAPESWETREASTLLGSCLLAQGRQTEAEPLLRKGAEPLPSAATLAMRRAHREGLLGIARWCEAVGRPEEAKTWREKRAAVEPAQVR